jgi:hypothetical protein
MPTVAELQPDPNREVRIVSHRQSSNGVYHDGIVREVTCANADQNLYAVTLHSPTYDREVHVLRLRHRSGDRAHPDGGAREH